MREMDSRICKIGRSRYKIDDVDLYEDCFARTQYQGCTALNEMVCKNNHKCSFYKPAKVFEEQSKYRKKFTRSE